MNTLREELIRDMSNMEDVMCRTAERTDIWQDRCVYAMAKAVYHIITYILRKEQ
jgi:hypothetical protein